MSIPYCWVCQVLSQSHIGLNVTRTYLLIVVSIFGMLQVGPETKPTLHGKHQYVISASMLARLSQVTKDVTTSHFASVEEIDPFLVNVNKRFHVSIYSS